MDPHAHFDDLVLGLGLEEADGVLRAVRREGQVAGPVHEDPGDPGNPPIECVKTPRAQSMTSTASFAVWAT